MVRRGWRAGLGVLGLALMLAGCGGKTAQAPAPTKAAPSHAKKATTPAVPLGELVTVTLTAKLPTQPGAGHPGPGSGGGGGGCPKGALQALLGIELANPEGIVIAEVKPNGVGAKAGLKPGDSIVGCNGSDVTCPSSLEPHLYEGEKPGETVFVVERRKPASPAKTLAKPAQKAHAKPAAK
jgi:predicted metalloprotease with PDZ domain